MVMEAVQVQQDTTKWSANEITPRWYWMKWMVTDKYGNKTRLGWKECSPDIIEAIECFRTDEYRFNQLNECATTMQDSTGTTGLVNEPHLELTVILRVRIVYIM